MAEREKTATTTNIADKRKRGAAKPQARNGDVPDAQNGGTPEGGMSEEDDAQAAKRAEAREGGSIEQRAQSQLDDSGEPGAGGEEEDGQLFVWEQGRKVTLSNIIARNIPVTHHFVFGGRRSKGQGGLMGFDAKPLMIVRGKPGNVNLVPSYKDDESLESVAIENHVKAVVVNNADSDDGIALIEHILYERGWRKPEEPAEAAAD